MSTAVQGPGCPVHGLTWETGITTLPEHATVWRHWEEKLCGDQRMLSSSRRRELSILPAATASGVITGTLCDNPNSGILDTVKVQSK